jgi:hypothetical protein
MPDNIWHQPQMTASQWGSQWWLAPAFSRRLDALESASAGRIACPTPMPLEVRHVR